MAERMISPRARECAEIVRAHDGIASSALAREMGITRPTVQCYLRAAKAAGLVRLESFGRYSRWHAGPTALDERPRAPCPSVWAWGMA